MEIFPYFFSVLLAALAIGWSTATARRKPGTPVSGLFRYREMPAPSASPPAKSAPGRMTAARR